MISYLLAGPAVEPLALAEARAWLRLDTEAEDSLVTTLIAAARLHVESLTGRALLTQSWRLVLDQWPADRVVTLPVAPLISLTAIRAFDDDDDEHMVPLAQFTPETGVHPARLLLPATVAGMPALRQRLGLEIDYVAGFGAEPEAVPADIKAAMLQLVAYWFENRDAVLVAGSGAVVPAGFDRALTPYRRARL
ncbi:head-tail connector protein [Devosia sp.]|uniref:head-tail connector protein n=1 Tax=Devosia sp. TaxID=1871048 RepID=UPI003A946C67